MTATSRVGVPSLTIASGILTAISYLPMFYLPAGSLRDENFNPVSGHAIALFILQFVIVGLIVVSMGVLVLAAPRWSVVWGGVALVLSLNSLRVSFLGSGGVLVIASIMGASGGLLGMLPNHSKPSETKPSLKRTFLRSFPFALLAVGLWGFSGIFLICGPAEGIGTAACDLLGPAFYALSTLILATILSAAVVPVKHALRYSRTQPKRKEASSPIQSH